MSHLARPRYTNKVTPKNIPIKESKTFISNCFTKSETITNTLSKRSAKIQGGFPLIEVQYMLQHAQNVS